MDRNHIIAWACGIFATLLVIMAGKGCMKVPEKPEKNDTTEPSTLNAFEQSLIHDYDDSEDKEESKIEYDEFGRPIKPTEKIPEFEAQIYTDERGNIIESQTDELTEAEPQYVTDPFGNTVDETVPPHVNQSEEEPAEATVNIPPGFGGFDHGNYDEDGNATPTIPPDFKIVIE